METHTHYGHGHDGVGPTHDGVSFTWWSLAHSQPLLMITEQQVFAVSNSDFFIFFSKVLRNTRHIVLCCSLYFVSKNIVENVDLIFTFE